jgi:hypothetical protein
MPIMKSFRLPLAAACLLAVSVPAWAQQASDTARLPITRIVLFTSGVGYFERDGQVDGSARVDLRFHTQNINDLLKSLVLQDAGGGRVSTVNYDNRDPIDKTLKSFAIDLTSNPTVGQLLGQVRGERVEASTMAKTMLVGTIVSVENKKKPAGKDQVIDTEQLNLLTAEGLHSIDLDQVEHIKFLKPELEQEFHKALAVLAAGHDKQKKTVTLQFLGSGKRPVRVAYVTEAPMWKASYRLGLNSDVKEKKAFLQGWAIVENTTDDDWHNVRMGLVSGRPISFQMDLYQPLYVPRPVVEPELFASLRPQVYGGSVATPLEMPSGGIGGRAAAAVESRRMLRKAKEAIVLENLNDVDRGLDKGVASAATAAELGEYFKYELDQPINLPRQKSSLIPIVNDSIEAAKVSIYNEIVQPKFPLLGLRFKNTSGLHLMQGPVTVFEGNSYAGDARIPDLQPKETRLLSYAVDLGTEVSPEVPEPADRLVSVKIYKGILHASHKIRFAKRYTVKNRSEHERVVLIEHPYRPELKLVSPEKPAERTRDLYRFELKAEPNKPAKLEVVEEQDRVDQLALTNANDDSILVYLRQSVTTPAVKQALEKGLKLRGELAETQSQIAREEQALQVIEKDQARMRANMERVPPTSEAYKRYLKKFDDQETEIEKRRGEITRLQTTAEGQRKRYEEYLVGLTIE